VQNIPGGSLNFERFETDNIEHCIDFIQELIKRSAHVNGVSVEQMKSGVSIVATGGGAHRFNDLFREQLGIEVVKEDEMECLIEGLKFITLIPDEVYFFSDNLLARYPPTGAGSLGDLERPSPNPPAYQVSFETHPTPQLPCLLVNIGSGVSIIKVNEDGSFERVSGTSLGGATLWGLLSLLTPATTFDGEFAASYVLGAPLTTPIEMLELSEKGDNSTVDMLVGDIYGQDYGRLGLKSTTIASSFGKVFKKGGEKTQFSAEDISKSLLYAVSNNIGQIAQVSHFHGMRPTC
jgi:type II pantothenate kinase